MKFVSILFAGSWLFNDTMEACMLGGKGISAQRSAARRLIDHSFFLTGRKYNVVMEEGLN